MIWELAGLPTINPSEIAVRAKQHEQQVKIARMIPPGETQFKVESFNPTALERFILRLMPIAVPLVVAYYVCLFALLWAQIAYGRRRTLVLYPEALAALDLRVATESPAAR